MASAHCLASGGIIGVGQAHGRDKLIATIEADGVTQYDINTNTPVRSWAIGKGSVQFSAPAVYHRASQHYFAAVQGTSGNSDPTLLSWSPSSDAGTIQQIATHVHLASPVASILPVSTAAAPKAQSRNADANAMSIDTPAQTSGPAVFVAHTNGSVSLCSTSEVLSENSEAAGSPVLAASVHGGTLHTMHNPRGSSTPGGALLGRFSVMGGKLRCEALHHVAPPTEEALPVAAAHSSGRSVVLWSDGSVAAYDSNSPLAVPRGSSVSPAYVRRLKGFLIVPAGASTDVAAGGKTPGRRKRGLNSSGAGPSPGCASLVDAGDGVIVVVGWTTGSSGLRLVAVDVLYGAIQSATDLSPSDIGTAKLDPSKPIQAVGLRAGRSRQIALAAGGSAIIAELDVRQPTLANLIGALSVPFQAQHAQQDTDVPVPAVAASSALHEDDLAQLVAPRGGTAGPLQYRIHDSGTATADLLGAADVDWKVQGAGVLRDAESSAWSKLLDAGSKKKGLTQSAFLDIAQPLLEKAQKARAVLSYDLLCKILLVAAESGNWDAIKAVLAGQHPNSLAGCPGLAAAMAGAHRYDLLHTLLQGATDVAAPDILAVLKNLLGPPPKEVMAVTARQHYANKIRQEAETAVGAAESAAAGSASNADSLIATAACAAGTVEGFSAAQLCLHPLIAARHDGAVLINALRGLPALHAVRLLKYLLSWLRNYRRVINDYYVMAPDLPELAVAPPEAILQWTSAAIDASMSSLMLRKDAAAVIAALQAEVGPQISGLRRLAQVKGAVEHLQCGAPLPAPPSGSAAGRYTLEWLSLKVA